MAYVEHTLMPGEQIVWRGREHWLSALLGPLTLLALGLLVLMSGSEVGLTLGILALVWSVPVFVGWRQQDFAVTDRRVITKRGLISRKVAELPIRQAEATTVQQGIRGRLLGFGDVVAAGTGGSKVTFVKVAKPMDLRSAIQTRAFAAVGA